MQRLRTLFVAGLLFSLIAALVAVGSSGAALAQSSATPTTATTTTDAYPAVSVVKQVGPAVVTVINEQTASQGPSGALQPSGNGSAGSLQPVGSGSGFIIDDQGDIVTNWHVVTKGQKFQVIFADGSTHSAKLIGSDEISDLAVVRVSGDLPGMVSFGDSSQLLPGDPVLAIGSPLGAFTNTVTEGIVSAIGRTFPQDQSQGPQIYTNLIQHDAAINPGNSGGPLFNLQGQVIGVNTLGIPVDNSGQPVQGLFFAIPSNTVQQITQKLIANGKVVYPFFGVSTQTVTATAAAQAGLSVDHGEYVVQVSSGGPAEAAGVKEGDVILSIDGQSIDAQHSFVDLLFSHQPGDVVSVKIQRGSKEMTIKLTLGERPTSS